MMAAGFFSGFGAKEREFGCKNHGSYGKIRIEILDGILDFMEIKW